MAFLGGLVERSAFFGNEISLIGHPRLLRAEGYCGVLRVSASVIGPGKKWEHYELNANHKPVRVRLHVHRGDVVQVIAGSDKGKVGRVSQVNTKTGEVLVDGVNIKTKHIKPSNEDEGGQIVRKEFPVHHSNVQHYSEAAGTVSRVGTRMEGNIKVRYLKKTGEVLLSTKDVAGST